MKVRKVGARGTSIRETDLEDQNWSGDAYRKKQQENLEKIGKNRTMHLGRGVRTTKLKDLPKSRPSTEGMTIILHS